MNDPHDYELIKNSTALKNTIERTLNYGCLAKHIYYPKKIDLSRSPSSPIGKISMTVTWLDGTKTTVTKSSDNACDFYDAFVWCLAKRVFGGTSTVKGIVNRGFKDIVNRRFGSKDVVGNLEPFIRGEEAEDEHE